MKKKFLSKAVVLALALSLVLGMTVTSYAQTGTKPYSGGTCSSYFNGSWSWPGPFKAKWTGTTGGKYTGTTTPTKITHSDVVTATGVGSVSLSSSGGSVSISGNKATIKYTASNGKTITCYPSYIAQKGMTFTVNIYTSTEYKFGSTYVTVTSYD